MRLPKSLSSITLLVVTCAVFVGPLAYANHQVKKQQIHIPGLTFANEGASALPTPSPASQNSVAEDTREAEAIENYARRIFGKDARVMLAIQKHECNSARPEYPHCVAKNEHEYSIGWAQINIQSEYTKVHYDRIPGKTLEEKVEWLQDPYNNVLMAYWIFSKSGFYPWTAYKTGAYLNSL